jgi:GxxExxY protein
MFADVTTLARAGGMAIDLARVNPLTEAAIGAAIKVHRALGPGLLESVYLACLVFELRRSGSSVRANVPLPVEYDEVRISIGFRLDIVVDDYVILELKSVKKLANIHSAQALTYLKLSGYPVAASGVSGVPLPVTRPAAASKGKTHNREALRSVVNTRRVPSRESAAPSSAPAPAVSCSAACH